MQQKAVPTLTPSAPSARAAASWLPVVTPPEQMNGTESFFAPCGWRARHQSRSSLHATEHTARRTLRSRSRSSRAAGATGARGRSRSRSRGRSRGRSRSLNIGFPSEETRPTAPPQHIRIQFAAPQIHRIRTLHQYNNALIKSMVGHGKRRIPHRKSLILYLFSDNCLPIPT